LLDTVSCCKFLNLRYQVLECMCGVESHQEELQVMQEIRLKNGSEQEEMKVEESAMNGEADWLKIMGSFSAT